MENNTRSISFSMMSAAMKGYNSYKNYLERGDEIDITDPKNAHILKGKIIDAMCTNRDDLSNYAVADLPLLTDKVKKVCDYVLQEINFRAEEHNFDTPASKLEDFTWNQLSYVKEAALEAEYGGKDWKAETILKRIDEAGGISYILASVRYADKIIVSQEIWDHCTEMSSILQNTVGTKGFFGKFSEYQKVIEWGDNYKGIVDILIHNKTDGDLVINRDISVLPKSYLPVELKYTDLPILSYAKQLKRARTDMQVTFYKVGLNSIYPEFVHPPVILGISGADKAAFWLKLTPFDLDISMNGGVKDNFGKIIPASFDCSTEDKYLIGIIDVLKIIKEYDSGNTVPMLSSSSQLLKFKTGFYNGN